MPEFILYQLKRIGQAPLLWVFYIPLSVVFLLSLIDIRFPLNILAVGLLFLSGLSVFWSASRVVTATQAHRFEDYGFKSILENLEDALIAYDKDFTVLFFNAAAAKLFELPATDVVGSRVQPQDASRDDRRLLIQVIFTSLAPLVVNRTEAGTYPQVVDVSFTDPVREFRVTTSPIADEKGNPYGFVKVIQDRTREVTLLRSKNEFITVASHQLRGPTTNVNWALNALEQDSGMSEESKALLLNARAASGELLKILEDLLNIAKIEEGQFGYHYEPTNLVEFIAKLLGEVLPRAREAGIKLYFERPKEAFPEITIDPTKLSMVILNLVENAVRYNVEGGEVVIKVEAVPRSPFLRVSVKDTGIGVSPSDVPKLFTKFFRASNALKAQTEGSGLGLYIAQNIIRAHGGQTSVESEPGRGTTISFTLPTDPRLIPQHEVSQVT